MKPDFNHIREWLQPQLDDSGWSVEDFATKCGLSRAAVYFFLNDKNRPTEQTMIRMCQVLGVPPEAGLATYTPRVRGRRLGFRPGPRQIR